MDWLVLVIVLLVVLIGAGVVYGHKREQDRRAALRALAQRLGFTFDESRRAEFDERFSEIEELQQGKNRYAYNVARGACGDWPAIWFDYHYETTSRDKDGKKTTHNHEISAVVFDVRMPVKKLRVRPENFFDRVSAFLGFEDIDFESDAFSRAYHVKCDDRKFAYDVIDQRMMEYLLEVNLHGRSIGMGGHYVWICSYQRDSVEEIEGTLGFLFGFLDRLSPSLVRELKETV